MITTSVPPEARAGSASPDVEARRRQKRREARARARARRLTEYRALYGISPSTTDAEVRGLMREQPMTWMPNNPEVTIFDVAHAVVDDKHRGITAFSKSLGKDPRTVKNAAAIAGWDPSRTYEPFWEHWRSVTEWIARREGWIAGPVTLTREITPSGRVGLLVNDARNKRSTWSISTRESLVVTPSGGSSA